MRLILKLLNNYLLSMFVFSLLTACGTNDQELDLDSSEHLAKEDKDVSHVYSQAFYDKNQLAFKFYSTYKLTVLKQPFMQYIEGNPWVNDYLNQEFTGEADFIEQNTRNITQTN